MEATEGEMEGTEGEIGGIFQEFTRKKGRQRVNNTVVIDPAKLEDLAT
jgi:hypothetical protein